MKQALPLFFASLVFSACGTNQPAGLETQPVDRKDSSADGMPHIDASSHVWQAAIQVDAENGWLTALGIPINNKKSVVVNAANGSLGGGGGLDGALCNWAKKNVTGFDAQAWRKGAKSPNQATVPNPLPTGEFAIFDTSFGWIYLAVGPIASNMSSLEEARNKVRNLYANMLVHAHKQHVDRIVLPAISTSIFAGPGKGFSKDEFLQAVYQGMIEGIENFKAQQPGAPMKIILNNWHEKVVQKINPL